MVAIKVGIIGGTGLKDIELFIMEEEQQLSTPFGDPSSPLTCGKMHGIDCVLLSRHGKKHNIMPSCVNFRANIYALKMVGCTHIIVTTACGSLREEIKPGHVVILDQFIDFTKSRKSTFYGGQPGDLPGVCHIPMQKPFNEEVRKILMESCKENNVHFHEKGTAIKSLIKWQNQMIILIKRMDNNCHIPDLVQAFSNVENGGLNLVL